MGSRERFIRTLKENLLWVRSFETIEELRLALLEFQRTYNEQWMLGEVRLSESSPSATRFRQTGRGSVEVITFKLLSKNPGALHQLPVAESTGLGEMSRPEATFVR